MSGDEGVKSSMMTSAVTFSSSINNHDLLVVHFTLAPSRPISR